MNQKPEPSDFELQILALLWQRGSLTVREVMEHLPDQKVRAYTSVLSVMQVMEKKGFLSHEIRGKAHVYSSKMSQNQVLGGVMGRLIALVFGGKPTAAMQALLEDKTVTHEELAQMRRLIEEKAKAK